MRCVLLGAATVFLVCGSSGVRCDEPSGDASDIASLSAQDVWKKVVERNKAWLQPSVRNLSYVATSRPTGDEVGDETPEVIRRVWVSGNKARFELDGEVPGFDGDNDELSYALIVDGEKEQYVQGAEVEHPQPAPARDFQPMIQGVHWNSAVQVLARDGLPDDSRIVERRAVPDGHVVVLETDLDRSRRKVGMGLYHVFYGSFSGSIGRVRIHIRTPEFVPVMEEYLEGTLSPSKRHPDGLEYAARSTKVEYGPEFMTRSDQLLPKSMRYTHRDVVLACRFQLVNEHWILESASNTRDGTQKFEMVISDVSTDPVEASRFEVATDEQR